ncbi:hypothetical protein CRYUN_Cryun09bG0135400 [Craigia yunnanensis]
MSFVGEGALSSFFEALLTKLTSSGSLHFATKKQVHEELKKWEKILRNIKAVIDDAEEKQMKDRQVKIWLAELQDFSYDADDILDEFTTEALGSKLMQDRQANRSKVRKIINTFTTNFSPNALLFSYEMMSKVKAITVRLQELVAQKSNLQLRENDVGRPKRIIERQPTTSLVNEALVYGREDKKSIIDLLLQNDSSDGEVSVIPIVGIGGIVTSEACNEVNDLNLLQVKLKEKLSKKNFLLVLDDIWNESYNDWTILRSPFEVGAPRSKIIVTTRNQNVSSIMRTVPDYSLKKLSNDDCLFISTQHSLRAKDFSGHADLKEIGEQIVKKCNGLPLAAKTVGGLLRTRVDPDAWKDVLENEIWNSSEEESVPALWLSYYHLPPHLKQCFSYCSILPKDYEFGEEEVVLLWMAEGLLQQVNSTNRQIEKLGSMYFQDLVSRSFFQISSRNTSRFVMHDLINGVAQLAAGEICFRVEGDKPLKISSRARYSSYIGYYISELPNSIGDLRHIRYLNFSYTKIKSLPDSICSLFNLHILLRGCDRLKQLPSNFRFLTNLRHLDIADANSIEGIPFGIGELIDLQALSNFVVGQGVGYQIRELKNLSELKGHLSISGLENLVNAHDALEARLFDKSSLDDLEMKWSADLKDNLLKAGVEKEALYIKGMSYVNRVGIEFYGENCSNAFPSLEILHLEEMLELKEWNPCQVDEKTRNFNCLRDLTVKKCPKLLGSLPSCLPCLEKLVIHDCQLLVVSVPNPSRELTSLWQNRGEWLAQSRCLRHLEILNCPQLVSMEIGEEKEELAQIETLSNLEYLRIRHCERQEVINNSVQPYIP